MIFAAGYGETLVLTPPAPEQFPTWLAKVSVKRWSY